MIEVDDTKTDAVETATHTRDDARASALGDDGASVREPGASRAAEIEPLVLQDGRLADDREQYHVEEFLQYHDRQFVENVYRAILRREPDETERAEALANLRGGRLGKVGFIERLLASSSDAANVHGSRRRVRVEGLPSPLMRRMGRVPVVGYLLRLARGLLRLPVLMQHQQQFEIYALAQQQLIADHVNQAVAQLSRQDGERVAATATPRAELYDPADMLATVLMLADALRDLSDSHGDLQTRTQIQVEQTQAALAELTEALTAQQQIAEALRSEQRTTADAVLHEQRTVADALRREQQLAADAQQEFLIQEQRVIVETQKIVVEELRDQLRELSARHERAREEFFAEARRLQSLVDEARRSHDLKA